MRIMRRERKPELSTGLGTIFRAEILLYYTLTYLVASYQARKVGKGLLAVKVRIFRNYTYL
jgi:hypothetical protein